MAGEKGEIDGDTIDQTREFLALELSNRRGRAKQILRVDQNAPREVIVSSYPTLAHETLSPLSPFSRSLCPFLRVIIGSGKQYRVKQETVEVSFLIR